METFIDKESLIQHLQAQNAKLNKELVAVKEQLATHTSSYKRYYERNKETITKRNLENYYKKKTK